MFMNDIQCYVILIAYSGHIVKTINNITNNKIMTVCVFSRMCMNVYCLSNAKIMPQKH